MSLKRKSLVFLLVISLFIALFAGCGKTNQTATTEDKPQQAAAAGGTFVFARSTDATTLDTGYSYSEADIDTTNQIYEGLVRYKNDNLDLEPCLATDWSSSEDGKTWTFNLRTGVKFQDGTDFNADAVVFSFMRLKDKKHPYYGIGTNSAFDFYMADALKEVKAIDEDTVEFTLNKIYAPFLTYLGFYAQFIVSPTAVKKYGKDFYKNPVGTGPFKLDEWKKDDYIKLSKFDGYWGEKPKLDSVIFKVVPEDSTRLMELQTGDVQAIKNITPDQLQTVKENESVDFIKAKGASLFYASLNFGKKPFDNVKVRQAVAHAIDLDKIVAGTYSELGSRAVNVLPPNVFAYDNEIKAYEYNPEEAKKLLAEAGYPNGFEMTLNVFAEPRIYVGKPVDIAELIKNDLSKVGIKVNVAVNEWATHRSITSKGEHQFSLIGWYDIPYPSNFLKDMLLYSSYNNYSPKELRDLADKAVSTLDESVQKEAYKKIQQAAHDNVAILPIAHSDYTAATLKTVKDFKLDSLGMVHFNNTSMGQ